MVLLLPGWGLWHTVCVLVCVSVCFRLIAQSTHHSARSITFLDIQRQYHEPVDQCLSDFLLTESAILTTLFEYSGTIVQFVWCPSSVIILGVVVCGCWYCSVLFFWSSNSVTKKYKGRRDVSSLDQFIQDMVEAGAPSQSVSLLAVTSNSCCFIPGLKPSLAAYPFHRSLPFLLQDWLHGFLGLFTDTSEHVHFLLFSFSVFPLFSKLLITCGRLSWLVSAFERTLKWHLILYHIILMQSVCSHCVVHSGCRDDESSAALCGLLQVE